ncbi:hypothetical protein GCM10023189_22620 [Nibrella saemangeumensis]|uniref:Secretion system C-terminal sorting domain-containing protein n=1 Tax=Nibrella saemangeumensis TaxID=1084526 RepID=A0ABP8MUF9_9BACT
MKLLSTFCRLVILLLMTIPSLAQSKVIFVDGALSTSGNGTSWATAYQTLQEALNPATSGVTAGDEIRVAQGVYKPTTNPNDRAATFLIPSGVNILGGYIAGTDTRTPGTSILSGDIDENDYNADGNSIAEWADHIEGGNSYHVVVMNATNDQTRLDGFVITAGKADTNGGSHDEGGGIYSQNGAPVLVNCQFLGNWAHAGAAFYLLHEFNLFNSKTPAFINCVFRGNQSFYGGVIYNVVLPSADDSGTYGFKMVNCSLTDNLSSVSGNAINSKMDSDRAAYQVQLTNCILWNNGGQQTIVGSGYFSTSLITVTNSLIEPQETDYMGTDVLTSNPLWNQNLTLTACSPAINAGTNSVPELAGITTDVLGNNRFYNAGTIDIGAIEYQSNTPSKLIFVNHAATGAANGSSWADAYTSLQPALQGACSGTEIRVAQGVYKPTTNQADSYARFDIPTGVSVLGGYIAGTSNRILGSSILSGDIDNNDLDNDHNNIAETPQAIQGQNSQGLVLFLNTDNKTRLDGFTITAARGSQQIGAVQISGFNVETAPVISNCRFFGNEAGQGGAMSLFGLSSTRMAPIIINCVFSGNSASSIGGAVYSTLSSSASVNPRFINCTFANNRATVEGAAIGHYGTTLTLINCILWNNEGAKAIAKRSYNAAVAATNCLIEPGATGYTPYNVLNQNPLWNADLTLTACSPAINAGLTPVEELAYSSLEGVPVDAGGQFRFYNGTADLGAFEFQGNFTSLPVTISPTSPTSTIGQSVTLTATAGTAYQWSTGQTTQRIAVETLSGTTPYSVTVTDAGGCSGTATTSVTGIPSAGMSVSGITNLCVKTTPASKVDYTYQLVMTISNVPANSTLNYKWEYLAPKSLDYKAIGAKGVTIGKVSFTPSNNTLTITGQGGNLNGLQDYRLRLTVTATDKQTRTTTTASAGTVFDGGCSLGSTPAARKGIVSAEEVQVSVYPNPVVEFLTVEVSRLSSPATIHLYDIQGRPQGQWAMEPVGGTGQLKASVGNLPEGIYILNVETADGLLHRQRVLKQR